MTVTALKPFDYQGRTVQPGETVDVRPIDAASLTYRRVAKFGGVVPRAAAVVAEPSTVDPAPRRRRTYRRRDLTAED